MVHRLEDRLQSLVEADPNVRFAWLFGSAATRGFDSARDIDLAISFVKPLSLFERGAFAAKLEGALGREVDVIDIDEASTLLRWEVVRTGRPLAAREPDALANFRARVPIEYFDLEPYLHREAEGLRRALGVR